MRGVWRPNAPRAVDTSRIWIVRLLEIWKRQISPPGSRKFATCNLFPQKHLLETGYIKEGRFVLLTFVFILDFSFLVFEVEDGAALGVVERRRAVEHPQDEGGGQNYCYYL